MAHTDNFYGPGTHAWPYWDRDLTQFLAWLAPFIPAPVQAPSALLPLSPVELLGMGMALHHPP